MSVSKTSVDNDQEAPVAFSSARRSSPSHFFKRLLKRGSTLKVEMGYSYRHSSPTVRRGLIFRLPHCLGYWRGVESQSQRILSLTRRLRVLMRDGWPFRSTISRPLWGFYMCVWSVI